MIADIFAKQQALVGQEVGLTAWVEIDQPRIDAFADVTEDHQWIHIDPARAARETPFGATIAHGFLTLSLASKFAYEVLRPHPGQTMGINYGFNKLRFLNPVVVGDRLRGRCVLNAITQKGENRLLRELAMTIEIEGKDTPALAAEWLGMAVFAPA
ncbi:MAG: MaoC family dehydratase [Pseudomonadota bacterium]